PPGGIDVRLEFSEDGILSRRHERNELGIRAGNGERPRDRNPIHPRGLRREVTERDIDLVSLEQLDERFLAGYRPGRRRVDRAGEFVREIGERTLGRITCGTHSLFSGHTYSHLTARDLLESAARVRRDRDAASRERK